MRYGNLKLNRSLFLAHFDALVRAHGEPEALRQLNVLVQRPDSQPPKYGDINEGRLEALLNIVFGSAGGEQMLDDILKRRLVPEWTRVVRLLVDSIGRCIPEDLEGTVLLPANTNFKLGQPDLVEPGVAALLNSWREFYPYHTAEWPSLDEVMTRMEKIRQWLRRPQNQANGVANLLKGPHFLGVMPKVEVADLGEFAETLVEAAGRAYLKEYPKREFNHYLRGQMKGQVDIAAGTRYGRFIRRAAKGSSVWLSFRACLQGFGIRADREQEQKMPERLNLAGVVDAAMEMIAYPSVLARNYHTVSMDCAANVGPSGSSLYFKANDDRLHFGHWDLGARDVYSGAFLVLG